MNTPDQGGAAVASAATDAEAGSPPTIQECAVDQASGSTPEVSSETSTSEPAAGQPTDAELEQYLREQERRHAEALAERRQNLEKQRAETPAQVVSIRPGPKQQLLGLFVSDDQTREILRTSRMQDWRTEELSLQAGQSAHVVVLVGDELTWFEECERQVKARREAPRAANGQEG